MTKSSGVQGSHLSQSESEPILKTPGVLLRLARERAGLTEADVAKGLCLSVSRVRDIEGDHHEAGSASIYSRGHLRNYARFLGVSEESVLAAFDQLDIIPADPKVSALDLSDRLDTTPIYQQEDSVGRARWRRWLLVSIFGLCVLFVVSWWHGQRRQLAASDVLLTTPKIPVGSAPASEAASSREVPAQHDTVAKKGEKPDDRSPIPESQSHTSPISYRVLSVEQN